MDIYRTDDEQAEALKKWWLENGRAVVVGIVIGLAVVVGVRYWMQHQKNQSQSASQLYAKLEKSLAGNDANAVLESGQIILKEYKGTAYAAMAAMAMAKVEVDAGKNAVAMDHLNWVVAHADNGMQHAARLRLARLLLNDNKVQEAADLVESIKSSGFSSGYEELRADIALARGNTSQARELYRLALATATGARREMLQMKLDSVPVEAQTSAPK